MNKTLLGALIVIPSLWAGMTWVASNKTEAALDSLLAQSQQRIAEAIPLLSIEKQAFSKGFVSSTAKSIIHLDPAIFELADPVHITLNHTLYHGPLMLTVDGIKFGTSYIITTLDQAPLAAKTKAAIKLIFADQQPFTSSTLTNFDDSINETLNIPAINIDSAALDSIFASTQPSNTHFKLNLDGISSQFNTNMTASYLNGLVKIGALSATGTNEQAAFSIHSNATHLQFDISELYHGSMLSGSVALTNSEVLLSKAENSISLQGISIKSLATAQNGMYNQSSTLAINKLLIYSDSASALFPESKLQLRIDLTGLEQTATKRLIDLSQSIKPSQLTASHNGNTSPTNKPFKTDVDNYLAVLNELIKPTLASHNVLKLSNEQGIASIQLDLNYSSKRQLIELKTLKELIIALAAELQVNIAKSMLADSKLEQLFDSPMVHNYIKSDNDTYTATAILKNGQLNLNDKPIPILNMLGAMAEKPLNWEQLLQ